LALQLTTDEGLVAIDTDPNVVIVDIISCIFVLTLYFKLSFCRHPSSRYNNTFVILNEDGKLNKVITCSLNKPLDVTCLDDTTVAVSTYNGIEIININSTEIERRIKTSQPCYGITHHNGVLLWSVYQKGIQMMKLSDGRVTTDIIIIKGYTK
jgi:hypothetical protein